MSLLPREAQNLLHSRFSCMLIPFSMFSLDYDEAKVRNSLLYGRGSKATILVGHHFQSGILPMERASEKNVLGGHIFARNWRPNQKCTFWWAYPTPLRSSSMSLLPREAQNLLHSRFSCILIPFSMSSLSYDEGKVKFSPLYGRGSKVTILVGRQFQLGMVPMARASKKT